VPEIVRLYRSLARKDLDPVEAVSLQMLKQVWADYESEPPVFKEKIRVLLCVLLEAGIDDLKKSSLHEKKDSRH